ncbi:hypothetical protein N431DRAFT_472928 [Stipitochalara longipes BDJ]|nr:hypothetical protein N431DRAFT_472928 [Stipitochalara longipes BDJ]
MDNASMNTSSPFNLNILLNEPGTVETRPRTLFPPRPQTWCFDTPEPTSTPTGNMLFDLNLGASASTWPFLNQPVEEKDDTEASFNPNHPMSVLAKEMEAERQKNTSLLYGTYAAMRELKHAFYTSEAHNVEWLLNESKMQEFEDALYDGKWRPRYKAAQNQQMVLRDTMASQERLIETLIESNKWNRDMIEEKNSEISKMLHPGIALREKEHDLANLYARQLVEKLRQDDAKTTTDESLENARLIICNLEERVEEQQEEMKELQKSNKDLEKVLRHRNIKIGELNEKIKDLKKQIEDLDSGMRSRERDVKVREVAVKIKEQELKYQPRNTKESTKESGKELKAARTQLKEAGSKIVNLEKQVSSAADDFNILKLDYETTVSELEALKIASTNPDQRPNEKIQEEFHRIVTAVRVAEATAIASLHSQFGVWKSRAQETIRAADEKLLAAEMRAEAAEKRAKGFMFAAEADIRRNLGFER